MAATISRRWDLKGRKQKYVCPLCKNEHNGFAMWRHHVKYVHSNVDPRYPTDVSDAAEAVDRGPVGDLLHCTWTDCESTFTTMEKLYIHFVATHKVDLLTRRKGTGNHALAQELGYEFENYLDKHRRFEEQYPEDG